MVIVLIFIPLAEPLVSENTLTQETESVQYPGYHSLASPGFPKYPMIDLSDMMNSLVGCTLTA